MDDQILTFVLLAIGFVLLGIEFLIPSGGLIGIVCIGSFLGSAYFAYQAWADSHPLYWRIYVVTFLALIPVVLWSIHYILTRTAFGNRVLLSAPTREEVTPYAAESRQLESLIGRAGTAISPLTPSGLVQVAGQRLHAVGDGFIIESGTKVEVVSITGTRIVVRPVPAARLTAEELKPSLPPELPEVESPLSHTHPDEVIDPFQDNTPT